MGDRTTDEAGELSALALMGGRMADGWVGTRSYCLCAAGPRVPRIPPVAGHRLLFAAPGSGSVNYLAHETTICNGGAGLGFV